MRKYFDNGYDDDDGDDDVCFACCFWDLMKMMKIVTRVDDYVDGAIIDNDYVVTDNVGGENDDDDDDGNGC